MDSQKEIIENFKRAVSGIWLRDGQNTWPIEINSIIHLFIDVFFEEMLEDINRLKAGGFDEKGIAARFKTSARIIRLIMPCVFGMKMLGMPIEKRREHVLYLLSLVKHLKHGDLFNRDGKNTVFSPGVFKNTLDETKMLPPDKKSSLLIHKLCAVLWNYAESVCFKTHGLIREFHGPYGFPGKHEEILIRDFYGLNNSQLGDECQAVQYENIRVVTAYENLGMTIDIYNNVSNKGDGSYINSLRYYYIEADGRTLNLEEVNRLCTVLSGVMIAITSRIEGLNWRQLAEKYAEIFWYGKKELRDEFKLNPRIPGMVKERIKSGELNTRPRGLNQRHLQRMLKIVF